MAVNLIQAVAGFRLNARDPDRLADFFVRALGFSGGPSGGLSLGPSHVALDRANGAAYPDDVPCWSPLFQHFAIVAGDMAAAVDRLAQVGGWTAISDGGPQTLPAASGGVTAFKFRDPEGHPLELIALQGPAASQRPTLHIDHSAISVRDSAGSAAFYEVLGFQVGARSFNHGPEQDRLDGLENAQVEVTALLTDDHPAPHVELLGYRGDWRRPAPADLGDVAATRMVFRAINADALGAIRARLPGHVIDDRGGSLLLRDPDGHLLEIEAVP